MDELSSVALMFGEGSGNEDGERKIVRNRLNLNQRIEVLKEYQRTPNINQLANIFQCGRRQIRNILRKRKKYLALWRRRSKLGPNSDDLLNAIGLVLYEWVTRAQCYQINITDDILRNFGQEIADHFKYTTFNPSNYWLSRFKQKFKFYNMQLNIKQERDIPLGDRKPLSIKIIIDDLRRQYGDTVIPAEDIDIAGLLDKDMETHDLDGKMLIGNLGSESTDSAIQVESEDCNMEFAKQIENYREALNQLGPLEQFALMKENIRAVGLINQLENLFREELEKDLNV